MEEIRKKIKFFIPKKYDILIDSLIWSSFQTNIPEELLSKKEEITVYEEEHTWELAKKLANPYEMVYTQEEKFPYPNISLLKPLSRSYFKMIEMISITNFINELPKDISSLRSAHIAEGPGGFIQAFIDEVERCRKRISSINAMTLKSDKYYIPGWKKTLTFLKKYENILEISYGKDNTGDVYSLENQNYLINKIGGRKVHFFTADGGFDFSIDYTQQEKQIFNLIVCSFLVGLQVLTINGMCIIKIFDTYSESTQFILSLCGTCFKEYSIYKPLTSRPCNSERYFIGKKFKGVSKSILNILLQIHANTYNDLYPIYKISVEEKEYIENISSSCERMQLYCINEAKKYAINPKLYEPQYKEDFKKCYEFCEVFKIPIKVKKI